MAGIIRILKGALRSSKQPQRVAWSLEHLHHERSITLGQSILPSTHIAYSSTLKSYMEFTRNHGFATDPTPDTLSLYITYMSHYIKPDSVNSYVSGICHELEPFPPKSDCPENHPSSSVSLWDANRCMAPPKHADMPSPPLIWIMSYPAATPPHPTTTTCSAPCS